jgi:hypothetical protein
VASGGPPQGGPGPVIRPRLRRGNKFNARKTVYNGRTYDSRREAQYAAELDLLLKAGKIRSWEPQFPVPLFVNQTLVGKIVIDFRVEAADGTYEWHEVKGAETPLWRLKWKLSEAIYPRTTKVVIR